MIQAKSEFETRLYQFALDEAEREVKQGFPLVQRVQSRLVLRFLELMKGFDLHEQQMLQYALAKRFHKKAELNESEIRWLEKLDQERLLPSRQEAASSARMTQKSRVKRKIFAEEIKKKLEPLLGKHVEQWSPHEWRYEAAVGEWTIFTVVDIGGKTDQLAYHHDLARGRHMYLVRFISVLSWLGIAGQTRWDLLVQEDTSRAIENLGFLCRHFLEQTSKLLDDLHE